MTAQPERNPTTSPTTNGVAAHEPAAMALSGTNNAPQPPVPFWPTSRPRVVIVGAGFGGLNAAQVLGQQEVDVLLIDRNNYHGFWPLLYQVATAGLEPEAIAYPVRAIVRKFRNVGFQMGEVKHVDFQNRLVYVDNYSIPYDYLILAAGSANNYFGNNTLADHTYGLKDIDEAENLRNRVLSSFERAIVERDPQRRKQLLTLAVVGGGPTGVELAGAFVELVQHVLRHDYPQINVHDTKVVLIEATDKILAAFPEHLRRNALKRLQRMGVEVRLNTAVASVEKERVRFTDGTSLETNTVVWAAGVRAANLADSLGLAQARGARVKVKLSLNLAEQPNVFVVGDMAYLEGYQKPDQPYPMVAQVAIQQGKAAAHNILNQVRNRPLQPFRYFDFGSMATIGRRSAVFDAFGIRLTGVIAWLGWLFIHLMYLVGFRNRVIVLINWAYNYLTYDRGVRLITGEKQE